MSKSSIAAPPIVECVSGGAQRPYWSVTIPTFSPNPQYLTETIESVLEQGLGPKEMEIEVVDDCSPEGSVEDIVRRAGLGRVGFRRNEKNLGLAGCWNQCLAASRGLWVHILHQDDKVLPGFYDALKQGAETSGSIGTAFSRHATIDEDGRCISTSALELIAPGMIPNWNRRICEYNGVLTPSVVVRRKAYECLGGFRKELVFALDWEMWQRISTRFSAWYEPQVLACCREHSASETPRLVKTGADIADLRQCIRICREYLPRACVAQSNKLTKKRIAARFLRQAEACRVAGTRQGALKRIFAALEFDPSLQVVFKSARIVARIALR